MSNKLVHIKNRASVMLGTILEWLEYGYYAYMAPYLSKLFFPESDYRTGLIYTYGLFIIGYAMRPFGALFFGHLGDKFGRKRALYASILLMSFSSMGIGLLPTYANIGIFAPVFLLFFRCLQGFSVSGEFNGGSIFLIEHELKKNKYFSGSLSGLSASIGLMLGALCATIVGFLNTPYAWRLPFLAASVGCMVGLYVRGSLKETPAFYSMPNDQYNKFPIITVFKKYKKSLMSGIILASYISVNVYVGSMFYSSLLIEHNWIHETYAKIVVTFGQLCVLFFMPLMGMLADRKNAVLQVILGLLGAIVSLPIMLYVSKTGNLYLIFLGQIIYALFDSMAGAPVFKLVFDLFPANVRYSGYSFSWSVGATAFGSTSLVISHKLISKFGLYGPCVYHSLVLFMAIVVVLYNYQVFHRKHLLKFRDVDELYEI